MYSLRLLLLLRLLPIWCSLSFPIYFLLIDFPFLLDLKHPSAQIIVLKMGSSLRALVLLPSFIISVYTLVVLKVYIVYILSYSNLSFFLLVWKVVEVKGFAVIWRHLCTSASITIVVLRRFSSHFVRGDCLKINFKTYWI